MNGELKANSGAEASKTHSKLLDFCHVYADRDLCYAWLPHARLMQRVHINRGCCGSAAWTQCDFLSPIIVIEKCFTTGLVCIDHVLVSS